MNKFQGWTVVKVTNPDSEHRDRVGFVVRTEHNGEREIVFVALDASDTVEAATLGFEVSELAAL